MINLDKKFMQLAIELARKGEGKVNPNPMVGAVIVRDGIVIGEGYHEKYGEGHAEVNAFKSLKEDPSEATMYVTLEPCSHYGKTPPCVDKIVENNIKRVVIGMIDPNPLVAGKGIDKLKKALEICEIDIANGKKSHGIKALRLAYKYGDRSSNTNADNDKRKGSIYMADSKVDVNGELKSVEDMSNEDIAYKLDLKNGTNWSGRNPNAKGIFKANF